MRIFLVIYVHIWDRLSPTKYFHVNVGRQSKMVPYSKSFCFKNSMRSVVRKRTQNIVQYDYMTYFV